MAKSKKAVEELAQTTGSGDLVEIQSADSAPFLDPFAMVLDLPADALIARAVDALNVAGRLNIAAGLCLLKAKSLCEHGQFEAYIKAAGMATERAQELMAVADLLRRTTPEDRKRLMQQPKTALIGLARMDDEIRQKLLETGELDERLTLTEYHTLIGKKDLQLKVQGDDIKRLKAQLTAAELTGRQALDAVTPLAIAQLRREAASYAQDALACIHGFVALSAKLDTLALAPDTQAWVTPASLSLVSLLQSIHEAASGQLSEVIDLYGLDKSIPAGPALMLATPGPEEAELIREAMTGVLIDFGRRHAGLEHNQYLETRAKVKTRGRPKKGPSSRGGA